MPPDTSSGCCALALVGFTILAPEQIGVEGDLPVVQTETEDFIGDQKIVFLCAALWPFVETQFIPPVWLELHCVSARCPETYWPVSFLCYLIAHHFPAQSAAASCAVAGMTVRFFLQQKKKKDLHISCGRTAKSAAQHFLCREVLSNLGYVSLLMGIK